MPGGHINAFCDPETTTSMPQASVLAVTAPKPKRRNRKSSQASMQQKKKNQLLIGDQRQRRQAQLPHDPEIPPNERWTPETGAHHKFVDGGTSPAAGTSDPPGGSLGAFPPAPTP